MLVGGKAHDYDAQPRRLAHNLSSEKQLHVVIASDLSHIDEEMIRDCDVLLFNTCETCANTGLGKSQQGAIVEGLRRGKGLVAMHCALYSFQDWPEWREMVGGVVNRHGPFGSFEVAVVDRGHPIAAGLPASFTVTDEPYFVDERGDHNHILVQSSRPHNTREGPEPHAWTTRYRGGRIFVTAFGHDDKVQSSPAFLKLLTNGILWAGGRLGPPTILSDLERADGFVPLFDGKTLGGWRYDPTLWKVQNGVIVGDSRPKGLPENSFAIFPQPFGDFILRFSIRVVSGNSGVQFRSRELPDFVVAGYQADAANLAWGNLHEQNGRGRLVDGWTGRGEHAVSPSDWNDMEVVARGRHIVIRVNGVTTADWTEHDASRPTSGIIALQLHRGEPMRVELTNVRIRKLTDASSTETSRGLRAPSAAVSLCDNPPRAQASE